jgi:hypothetical protein
MEINISAVDMLRVLVESGIDETESKAIIFDLLHGGRLEADAGAGRSRLKAAKRKRLAAKEPEDEDEEDEEEEEDEPETRRPLKKEKPKRINFSQFGGPAESILSGGRP